jgi:hypothetical protein
MPFVIAMGKGEQIGAVVNIFPLRRRVVHHNPGGAAEMGRQHLSEIKRSLRVMVAVDDDHMDGRERAQMVNGLHQQPASVQKGLLPVRHFVHRRAPGGGAAQNVGVKVIIPAGKKDFCRFESGPLALTQIKRHRGRKKAKAKRSR